MKYFNELPKNVGFFAEHLYNTATVQDLEYMATGYVDWIDCSEWLISHDEWRGAVEAALAARLNTPLAA